jgi:hypothetical protein
MRPINGLAYILLAASLVTASYEIWRVMDLDSAKGRAHRATFNYQRCLEGQEDICLQQFNSEGLSDEGFRVCMQSERRCLDEAVESENASAALVKTYKWNSKRTILGRAFYSD